MEIANQRAELLFGLASVDFATLEHVENLGREAGGLLAEKKNKTKKKKPEHFWWSCLPPALLELL